MKVLDCDQGSAAWLQARVGLVTSSKVADAIAKLKRKEGEAACRRQLKWELVGELLTNRSSEHYVSLWMEQGIENEPYARAAYEIRQGVDVDTVGFVLHDKHPELRAGCSPDGLVGSDGVCELKCPKLTTHLQYLRSDTIPDEYLPQCMWHLACTGRQWIDFVSYHPLIPDLMLIKRLHRDEKVIAQMELEVAQLQREVDEELGRIRERNAEEIGVGA